MPVAIAVAINILWTGFGLVRHSTAGLMDHAMPAADVERLRVLLRGIAEESHGQVAFHAVQTREAGRESYVSMHVLVPGSWTVAAGHDLLEAVEEEIREALPDTIVQTHLEPIEDPRSWEDQPPGGLTIPDEQIWSDA